MNENNEKCIICGTVCKIFQRLVEKNSTFCGCPNCGRFAIYDYCTNSIDKDKFTSFLYYNAYPVDFEPEDKGAFYIGSEEMFKNHESEYSNVQLLTSQDVEAWYPKNFSEMIDMILLGLAKKSDFYGEVIDLTYNQKYSAFFLKRYRENYLNIGYEFKWRKQVEYIEKYLEGNGFVKLFNEKVQILPDGLKRIDELEKNQVNSKNVFVAMSFAPEMRDIREAIRKAIIQAGYTPRIMDEITHNNQVIPEMLYEIRQSKFVVAEFTGHNNGAYYEAGYAAGLGKEVIHVCHKDTFATDGHFDVKQKATLLWGKNDELTEKLYGWIKGTVI